MIQKKSSYWFVISLMTVFFCAIILQTRFIANWDAGILLDHSWQILQGKQYYVDFFEANPPLIMILYFPAAILSHLINIRAYLALEVEVYLLSFLSLYLSWRIVKKDQYLLPDWQIIFWAIIFWILPGFAFTEREQITLILSVPYFYLATDMLIENFHHQHATSFRFLIALIAGVGFALKPYFLIPWILIEGFLLFKLQRIKILFRLESIVIAAVIFLYILLVYFYFAPYWKVLFPLMSELYAPYFQRGSILELLTQIESVIFILGYCVLLVYYFVHHKWRTYGVFYLAGLGFFLARIAAGQNWYYHFYPAFSLLFYLMVSMAQEMIIFLRGAITSVKKLILISIMLFLSIFILLSQGWYLYCSSQHYLVRSYYEPFHPRHLIRFLNLRKPGEPVLLFSTYQALYNAVDSYTKAKIVFPMNTTMFTPGMKALLLTKQQEKYEVYANFYFSYLMKYLRQDPPNLIIIDVRGYPLYLNGKWHIYPLLPFFLSNPEFACYFSHYHWLIRIGVYNVYQKISDPTTCQLQGEVSENQYKK